MAGLREKKPKVVHFEDSPETKGASSSAAATAVESSVPREMEPPARTKARRRASDHMTKEGFLAGNCQPARRPLSPPAPCAGHCPPVRRPLSPLASATAPLRRPLTVLYTLCCILCTEYCVLRTVHYCVLYICCVLCIVRCVL